MGFERDFSFYENIDVSLLFIGLYKWIFGGVILVTEFMMCF